MLIYSHNNRFRANRKGAGCGRTSLCYDAGMDLDGSARRRWFGAAVLAAAAVMLVAGATVLQGRLEGMAFLVYWLGCFVLTMAAIMVAFRDARAVHQITRREHRDLIENTMRNIELEARNRRRGRNDSAP